VSKCWSKFAPARCRCRAFACRLIESSKRTEAFARKCQRVQEYIGAGDILPCHLAQWFWPVWRPDQLAASEFSRGFLLQSLTAPYAAVSALMAAPPAPRRAGHLGPFCVRCVVRQSPELLVSCRFFLKMVNADDGEFRGTAPPRSGRRRAMMPALKTIAGIGEGSRPIFFGDDLLYLLRNDLGRKLKIRQRFKSARRRCRWRSQSRRVHNVATIWKAESVPACIRN